jgi:uncharacterized UBP type Zn finger protein
VQFARFTHRSDVKNNTPVHLPSGRFQVKAHEYRIHAVICYHGPSIFKGHYTAVVRDEAKYDSTWTLCNDSEVTPIEWKNFEVS